MFQDLDKTLAALLQRELAASNVAVSFAAPDSSFPPMEVTLPAVDLFLYDVRENLELHSNDWHHETQNGRILRHKAPIRIDCSYLITAWSSATNPIDDEHRLLGEVMKVLLRYRQLPDDVLQGELIGLHPPVRARAMRSGYLQSLGEFWQAMGGKPKASLHYTLTISANIFAPEDLGVPTTERIVKLQQGVAGKK
ncbi:hypothetical protein MNBD_CHLOROFLEXI01-3463 [hydrothermal vent metagenome]|uniref:Pvc16 N-terminal domain-containing protein n=1 Tax=hydrothermal vent metagenome TaxID=652676 RepID=A0A3B0V4S3_9ZZZZ